jgi:tellurium resistance protein TerD
MSVSLKKGGNLNLSKESPGLSKITVGLGWSARQTFGAAFDLDASAFLLKENGRVRGDTDFIFYNQLESTCHSVAHTGDNRTGEGDGDDEAIQVDLDKIPSAIQRVVFTTTIFDHQSRNQNFGQIEDAYIRVVDEMSGREIARYDLSEDSSTETAMIFGEIYRHNGDWKFRAVGQGFAGGLGEMAKNYGVDVE